MQGFLDEHRLSYLALLSDTCPRQGRGRRRCPTVNGSTFLTYPTDPLRLTPVTGKGTNTTTTQHEKTCSSFTCAEARYITNKLSQGIQAPSIMKEYGCCERTVRSIKDKNHKSSNSLELPPLHSTRKLCGHLAFLLSKKVNGLTAHAEQSRSKRRQTLVNEYLCNPIH